jgi:hypothetical protein
MTQGQDGLLADAIGFDGWARRGVRRGLHSHGDTAEVELHDIAPRRASGQRDGEGYETSGAGHGLPAFQETRAAATRAVRPADGGSGRRPSAAAVVFGRAISKIIENDNLENLVCGTHD